MTTFKINLKLLFSFFTLLAILAVAACGGKQDQETETETEIEMSTDADAGDEHPSDSEHPESTDETSEPPATVETVEGEGADLEKTYLDASGNTVYNHVETAPAFVGGNEALYEYLSKEISYPIAAKDAGAEGTVVVAFVIASDGGIRDVEVTTPHEESTLNDEASRVVSEMPAWEPGKEDGQPVDTRYSLPITFKLN